MGLEPPSPLPLNATTKTPQMLRGIRNIVRLSEWFADREDNIEPDIRGISDSTGTLPTFLTMEPEGRILRNEGDVLRPTGGFVHIIPAGLSKPSDFARAREILEECLDAYPDFLIGHAAHKPFKEWNNKCARGRVVGIDKDHSGNTLWQIRYEADDKEEDYDKSDMIQYVIRREFGVSDPDGGISAMLQARARARETCAVPEPEPESTNSRRESNVFSEPDDPSASKQSGGENTSGKSTSKSTSKIHTNTTIQPTQDVYETRPDDSWATVRKNCGVTIEQQRDFLRWLSKVHNIGSSPTIRKTSKVGLGTWIKPPIGGRQTRSPWSVPAGTKFPIPSGKLWDEMTKKHELKEKELRHDHLQNQTAAAAAFAEECMVNTGRLYFIEEMFDLNHMSEPEKPDYLYYVDKVNEGYIDPGADPKQSKFYCDTSAAEATLFNFGDDKFNTTYISIHTDDLDIIGDSLEDIKEVVKVLDSQFGHNGNSGVKVIDPKEVLGVRRIEGTDGKGTRYLHLHQAFKCDELWDADSQHACADALIVRTYVDPVAHSRLRTVGGARSGSSRRILSAQICTTVQPYRMRVSVSAVRCPTIRSVDPRSPTRSPVSSGRVRRSIRPTSLQRLACMGTAPQPPSTTLQDSVQRALWVRGVNAPMRST